MGLFFAGLEGRPRRAKPRLIPTSYVGLYFASQANVSRDIKDFANTGFSECVW